MFATPNFSVTKAGNSLRSIPGMPGFRPRFVGLSIDARNGYEVTASLARAWVGNSSEGCWERAAPPTRARRPAGIHLNSARRPRRGEDSDAVATSDQSIMKLSACQEDFPDYVGREPLDAPI